MAPTDASLTGLQGFVKEKVTKGARIAGCWKCRVQGSLARGAMIGVVDPIHRKQRLRITRHQNVRLEFANDATWKQFNEMFLRPPERAV